MSESARTPDPGRRAWLLIAIAVALGTGITGCVRAFEFGRMTRPAQLATLQVGLSTEADVLRALGEPRGRGAARLVGVEGPRSILLYDAYRGDSGSVAATLLVVFLHEGRYDGYLWMSTATPVEKRG